MKRLTTTFAIICALFFTFTACSDSPTAPDGGNDDGGGQNGQPTLAVSNTSVSVPSGSGSTTVTISNSGPSGSTLDWQISSNAGWLSFSATSGTGKDTVTISYNKAATGRKRTATISITSNGGDQDVKLTQQRADFYLAANDTTIICSAAGAGDTGTINGTTYTKRTKSQITTSNAAQTCTSGITDMSRLFENKTNFNKDISGWDVGSVTNMYAMFRNASSFNQDLSGWNVSSVTDMSAMFINADAFDGDIGGWDVSSVTDMSNMFAGASSFNADLSGWNVSSVTDMSGMFFDASSFNQDLTGWCVSQISSKPFKFAAGTSALQPGNFPNWGTCPSN